MRRHVKIHGIGIQPSRSDEHVSQAKLHEVRDKVADRIDVLALEAQFPHEGEFCIDGLLAQVAQIQVDD